jgi:hypothetical protein
VAKVLKKHADTIKLYGDAVSKIRQLRGDVQLRTALADELAAVLINLLAVDSLRHLKKAAAPQILEAEAALIKYEARKAGRL